jgi:hypothetical protein
VSIETMASPRSGMGRRGLRFAGRAIAAALAATVELTAQGGSFARGGGSSSTARVVSPAVVASWMSHARAADGRVTTLLVLWRGTPGWFSRGGGGGGSGGSGGVGPGGSYGTQWVSQGGLTFTLEYDYDKRVVKVLDQEVSLDQTNVVLVDSVDSAAGPVVVGLRWVEPAPAEPSTAGDAIGAIVRRAPELFEFLRCDVELSDPAMQAMMPIVCGQMRPR